MRSIILALFVAAAYAMLRGWEGAPPLLLRSAIAVAILLIGFCVRRKKKSSGEPEMSPLRKASWADYLALVSAIVVAEFLLVTITSTMASPLENMALTIKDYTAGLNQRDGEGVGSGGNNRNGDVKMDGHTSGKWLFSKNLERQLPQNSSHKPTNKPEVFVEVESRADALALMKSRLHLRSFAFSKFDGTRWSAMPLANKKTKQLTRPISFPTPPAIISFRHTIYQPYNETGQNVFCALHGCSETDLRSLTQVSDALFLLPPLADQTNGYTYSASSTPLHFTDLTNSTIAAAEPSEHDLYIPPQFQKNVPALTSTIAPGSDLATRLAAIKAFLRSQYDYSLETTNAANANPLENFLFIEKRGYCEHFATATALLCRSIGVPSRIAYGWSGGRLFPAQNMFVFRAKDSHAWAEIHLKDYGWVVFDTTPNDANGAPTSSTAEEEEIAPEPESLFGNDEPSTTTSSPGVETSIPPQVPSIVLAVTVSIALILLLFRFITRPGMDQYGEPIEHTLLPYYTRFQQSASTLGYPMPKGTTLRQHLKYIAEAGEAPPFAKLLLDYHYQLTYGEAERNSTTEKSLIQAIKDWGSSSEKT
ncbi:MAG: transglutaminase-like domain-containing protein [Akkermansiaceae bacterium]